jgi:hypothetical protein
MKVSAFTFVKNAAKYSYPVVESIRSILPMVDEFVVCLGDSEDNTTALVQAIDSDKLKIIHSVWDNSLREGGKVLAVETNKAMNNTSPDSDWLFYIQADELVHEKYHDSILQAMQRYKNDKHVEGLLFKYHHFYGSYKYIGDGRLWYSKEIRIIRNNRDIRSYKDAQGFRWKDNRKLNVKLIDAYIYHYGWVRNPLIMNQKINDFHKLYHPSLSEEKKVTAPFDYSKVDSVTLFEGTHPEVMTDIIQNENWNFEQNIKAKNFKNLKHRLLYFLWKNFGWRPFEYSNYKRI